MPRNTPTTKTARIWLPYFKQGDDMNGCLVMENDKVDARASIGNHINLLKVAIDQLEKIKNGLPGNSDFHIEADTHFISITGDKNVIERLHTNQLVEIDDDEYEDEDEFNEDESNEDESDEGSDKDEGNEDDKGDANNEGDGNEQKTYVL